MSWIGNFPQNFALIHLGVLKKRMSTDGDEGRPHHDSCCAVAQNRAKICPGVRLGVWGYNIFV